MSLRIALLLAALAGCGKASDSENPAGYEAWKTRNFILSQGFPGGGTMDGTIAIEPGSFAGGSGDWMEVALNGTTLARFATGSVPSGISRDVRFRPGPNWIRFFSSAALRGWEYEVDPRFGTRFSFTPKDKSEWEMVQQKDE